MEYNTYTAILYGFPSVLLFLGICVFISLSNRLLAELVEKLFGIIRPDNQRLIMNFYGVHIDFLSSRRFRLSLIGQLVAIAWIILLLFDDGCLMQVQHLSGQDVCPLSASDCFTWIQYSPPERVVCQSGEILSNLTSSNVVCFVWIYTEQNAVSVLNQIGICSSVFSLLCHTFRYACRMSRKLWGLVLLTLLTVILITLFVLSFAIQMQISMTAKFLVLGSVCLLINVIQLFQFTHHYNKCKMCSPATEQQLNIDVSSNSAERLKSGIAVKPDRFF